MDILSAIMEGIRALREKLASLKYEHRVARTEIDTAEKDLDSVVKAIPAAEAEVDAAEKDAVKNQSFSPVLIEKQKCLIDLEEEKEIRRGRVDALKQADADRQAKRMSVREELAVEREKARKAANRAISAATTSEELDAVEAALRGLSLPLNRVRVKRRWL